MLFLSCICLKIHISLDLIYLGTLKLLLNFQSSTSSADYLESLKKNNNKNNNWFKAQELFILYVTVFSSSFFFFQILKWKFLKSNIKLEDQQAKNEGKSHINTHFCLFIYIYIYIHFLPGGLVQKIAIIKVSLKCFQLLNNISMDCECLRLSTISSIK